MYFPLVNQVQIPNMSARMRKAFRSSVGENSRELPDHMDEEGNNSRVTLLVLFIYIDA